MFRNLKFISLLVFFSAFIYCRNHNNNKGVDIADIGYHKPFCLLGLCFNHKPILIDSSTDQTNYNGLLLRVYKLQLDSLEFADSVELISKGFQKFPPMNWVEVPIKLRKFIGRNDFGYYKDETQYGDRYLILDISSRVFILYELGFLKDLYLEDSLKRLQNSKNNRL
jgi:hypothetical protein